MTQNIQMGRAETDAQSKKSSLKGPCRFRLATSFEPRDTRFRDGESELHATWLHLPGAVAKFNYSCTINRLTYINIYIAEMQSVANGFMVRAARLKGASGGRWGRFRCNGAWPICGRAPAYANSFPARRQGRWSFREMELRRQ